MLLTFVVGQLAVETGGYVSLTCKSAVILHCCCIDGQDSAAELQLKAELEAMKQKLAAATAST